MSYNTRRKDQQIKDIKQMQQGEIPNQQQIDQIMQFRSQQINPQFQQQLLAQKRQEMNIYSMQMPQPMEDPLKKRKLNKEEQQIRYRKQLPINEGNFLQIYQQSCQSRGLELNLMGKERLYKIQELIALGMQERFKNLLIQVTEGMKQIQTDPETIQIVHSNNVAQQLKDSKEQQRKKEEAPVDIIAYQKQAANQVLLEQGKRQLKRHFIEDDEMENKVRITFNDLMFILQRDQRFSKSRLYYHIISTL